MPNSGLLDLLDRSIALIEKLELTETNDPSRIRKNQNIRQNARLNLEEMRRRIERTGQETPT